MKDNKAKLKELFFDANSTRDCSDLNSTQRKTRKDFAPRYKMNQAYAHRTPVSASPIYQRCGENYTDSNDEMNQCDEDYDENDQEDMRGYLYETPQNMNEFDVEYDSQNDTAPSAPTREEEIDVSDQFETAEDLKKLGLKDLIYKLFLNIYNSEKESIVRLKKEIFPRITEETQLDKFITYAISN